MQTRPDAHIQVRSSRPTLWRAPPAPAPSPNGVPRLSLADALFQAWQRARHPKPCGKELKEAMATVRKTGALFKAQRQPRAGAAVGWVLD